MGGVFFTEDLGARLTIATRRYYQPWLDAQSLVDSADGTKGLTYAGFQPRNSRDKALTAFAQLAALRLDVRRAMVSLIDSNRQYILAEATKTLSLFSRGADVPEDDVWLGNTIIARHDAVCHHTFTSDYTARGEDGEEYTAEALVIPDCRADPRFSDRDYVKGEPGVRFYAGVPIITQAGYRIGVYAVSDENPRDGLSPSDLRFMEDVAAAVMEHLELAKHKNDRNKGERMVRGLTEFIERSSLQDARNDFNNRQSTMEKQTENARLDALAEDDEFGSAALAAKHPSRKRTTERESEAYRIFHRAARIIRQSTDADGVVFFDTSAAGIKGHMYEDWSTAGSSDESGNFSTTDFDTADSATTSRRRTTREATGKPTGSWQDPRTQTQDFGATTPDVLDSKPCPVIGASLRATATEAPFSEKDFFFTESGMERYIHKYPYGKCFHFGDDGVGINSSDERSERSETDYSDSRATPESVAKKPRRRRKERFTPSEFLKVLPNVRSLIFLPLWDPAAELWVAGGFIWTTSAGKLMSPENELPYLKAFGNSITSELARASAQRSDRAKTTFIASISHELRSPLHGILGSVEFLQDTVSSSYQESLVSSIDVCGKTLLDTIDHVLDHAKINKLRDAHPKRKQREGRNKRLPGDNSILGMTTDFDLSQLVEEVCETVCVGHNFRKLQKPHGSALHDQASRVGEDIPSGKSHSATDHVVSPASGSSNHVAVTLSVTPFKDWVVRSQPGALRRIVMNLLGNALKYTESGHIKVSLLQGTDAPGAVGFMLRVEDSGKGMSADYQRTKLFAPFSQEDPFSSGTGLGLSIVKQIIESLMGDIEVKSASHTGTTITVSLKLPAGQPEFSRSNQKLFQAPGKLKNMSVSINVAEEDLGSATVRDSMRQACHGFNMKAFDTLDLTKAPDFLITDLSCLDSILGDAKAHAAAMPLLPIVCICADPTIKATVEPRIKEQVTAFGWIVDVVSQP